jgi:glycosyltransferase involved in cell wall biosynthesis
MIKVAALTSGKKVPSTRFRVLQHIKPLEELGVEVQACTPLIQKYMSLPLQPGWLRSAARISGTVILQGTKLSLRIPGILSSWTSQVTWLERELLPGYLTMERYLKKPLAFDVDDAIWLYPPHGMFTCQVIAKSANLVIAGNKYIADWFSSYARDIRIIPTAIDTDRFTPQLSRNRNGPFTIGWTGTSSTISYLEALEDRFHEFINDYNDTQLLVVADVHPTFKKLSPEYVRYVPWSPNVEVDAIHKMDIGIMPLPDTEWTRGKCSFKLLQYMACGIPVIASPVGMNRDVLNMGTLGLAAETASDWYGALEYFYKNHDQSVLFGNVGRSIAKSYFSRKVIAQSLAQIFIELAA